MYHMKANGFIVLIELIHTSKTRVSLSFHHDANAFGCCSEEVMRLEKYISAKLSPGRVQNYVGMEHEHVSAGSRGGFAYSITATTVRNKRYFCVPSGSAFEI